MADPLAWLAQELDEWNARGLRRRLLTRDGAQSAAHLRYDGRQYLNFGSNDYLGLAASDLLPAVRASLDRSGWGAGASPLVTGRGALHAQLEQAIARFEGTEAALLFTTGYAANVGAITALAGIGDGIFSDAKNHASIIDGCRLSGATVHVYSHLDTAAMETALQQHGPAARRRLIVSDSLFSMDGDLAPLPRLVALAEQYDCMLMVDEAHATGVFGPQGRGVAEHFACDRGIHVRIGTLSKALGSHGGFVAGSQVLIDWLANLARPYVFSTAAPEALAAAGLAALEIVAREPQRRSALLAAAENLRRALRACGWNVGRSESQIIPVIVGDPQQTMQASLALRERGLWVPGIRPPSVPAGESLLRISLSSAHTPPMIAQLVEGLAAVLPSSGR